MNAREIKRIQKETAIVNALLELEAHLDGYNPQIIVHGSSFGTSGRRITFSIRDAINNISVTYGLYHSGKTLKTIGNRIKQHIRTLHHNHPHFFNTKGADTYLKKLNYLLEQER